ncbi:MAG TPA: saccharopine dehydrogenase NADP-binding domain-containing protein [Vicinamibacteria bacterium]
MAMTGPWLLYGANGYTGELVARLARAQGHRPILAGRSAAAVCAISEELGLERRLFSLEEPGRIDDALAGMGLVLHCAGPFSRTSRPMADACLRTRTHYLDLTGEVEVFEALAARDAEARAFGVMLLPGCGFDVVPSDCLAVHLKRRLPGARRLALAYGGFGRLSRGTATTAIERLGEGGLVRRGGVLARVPSAWKTRRIDFGEGARTPSVTIPLGDLSAAWHSTGIPDIELYFAAPPALRALAVASRYVGPLLGSPAVKRLLTARVQAGAPGPTDVERRRGRAFVWGEVEDAEGRRAVSRLATPEGYTFTARAALAVVGRVLAGRAPAGFQTPGKAYGPDFVLSIEGVTRTDDEGVRS